MPSSKLQYFAQKGLIMMIVSFIVIFNKQHKK